MRFDTITVIFFVLFVCITISDIGGKYFSKQASNDPLAQQIEAINQTWTDSDQKTKLIQQLIEKYKVASNSIPIDKVVEMIPVEATNVPSNSK